MLTPINPMTPDDLRENMVATYFTLRGGLVLLSFAFPVILYFYSAHAYGELNESSISAFYGADAGRMRNYFVGTLCIIGALLVMYKGFSVFENWMLKAAGVSAILVATTPCDCWHPLDGHDHWHTAFALAFFACMVMVCEFCAFDTITLLPKTQQKWFGRAYHLISVFLIVSPAGAVLAANMANVPSDGLFFIEWFGVWMFALYWATKSAEFHITAAEKRALKGELKKVKGYGLAPVTPSSPSSE